MQSLAYWNDEERERQKPYGVTDVTDQRLLTYLKVQTNLLRCFDDALKFADAEFKAIRGTVLDLAAGVCWTSAQISQWPAVVEVHAFDFSQHRLFKAAPIVFEQLGAVAGKIHRHCESMFPLPYEPGTADVAVFCQALYMADRPGLVLRDVYRVLRPGGLVLIACERIEPSRPGYYQRARHAAAVMYRNRVSDWKRALAGRLPDDSGRFPCRDEDYQRFVADAGFRLTRQVLDYPVLGGSSVPAVNYFGIKA